MKKVVSGIFKYKDKYFYSSFRKEYTIGEEGIVNKWEKNISENLVIGFREKRCFFDGKLKISNLSGSNYSMYYEGIPLLKYYSNYIGDIRNEFNYNEVCDMLVDFEKNDINFNKVISLNSFSISKCSIPLKEKINRIKKILNLPQDSNRDVAALEKFNSDLKRFESEYIRLEDKIREYQRIVDEYKYLGKSKDKFVSEFLEDSLS